MWYAVIIVLEEPAASIFKVEETIKMTEVGSSKTKVNTYQATQYHKSPIINVLEGSAASIFKVEEANKDDRSRILQNKGKHIPGYTVS
jgi:hypothetical protein